MKQLLMESMLGLSFYKPVTDNCHILVLKKMYTIKNITRGFGLYPPDINQDVNDLKHIY